MRSVPISHPFRSDAVHPLNLHTHRSDPRRLPGPHEPHPRPPFAPPTQGACKPPLLRPLFGAAADVGAADVCAVANVAPRGVGGAFSHGSRCRSLARHRHRPRRHRHRPRRLKFDGGQLRPSAAVRRRPGGAPRALAQLAPPAPDVRIPWVHDGSASPPAVPARPHRALVPAQPGQAQEGRPVSHAFRAHLTPLPLRRCPPATRHPHPPRTASSPHTLTTASGLVFHKYLLRQPRRALTKKKPFAPDAARLRASSPPVTHRARSLGIVTAVVPRGLVARARELLSARVLPVTRGRSLQVALSPHAARLMGCSTGRRRRSLARPHRPRVPTLCRTCV